MWIFCFLLGSSLTGYAQQQPDTKWFTQARYGMFIHWGLYSAAEGLWKGEPLRYMNDYAEWIRYRNRISKDEYGKLAQRFQWDKINPEEWVKLAKQAGMKYIIVTTKHHDGVAIWDTKVNDYSLPQLADVNRDIIKELAEACRKYNMKLGFYYSHWIDWAHPYGWDHNQELTGKVSDEQYNQYWQEKVIPQLRELLTNYGDIAVMWFDMWIPYQKSIIQKEQLVQVAKMIRKLQPDCLINSRLGLSPNSSYVDFETFGDNSFGTNYIAHPWETPGTIAHSWGYNGQDHDYKSVSQILDALVSNVSLNGNYTLNIGPRADGLVPYESAHRLKIIGNWLEDFGESIYGNTGLGATDFEWGYATFNPDKNAIYLHVFNWPLEGELRFTGLTNQPEKVEILRHDKAPLVLNYSQNGPLMHIKLPAKETDPYDAVIRITLDDLAIDKAVVAESTFGGFELTPINSLSPEDYPVVPYDGKRPTFAKITNQTMRWKVYLPAAGRYQIDLSAHNPNPEALTVQIKSAKQQFQSAIRSDGKVVAEPNQHNYTDEFVDHHLQIISVDKPQFVELQFSVPSKQEIWFNHLWIKAI